MFNCSSPTAFKHGVEVLRDNAFVNVTITAKEGEVDLIFLDLNIPKLKGFEFLKTLQNPPNIIITTAYQQHALEGYELNIVYYLQKPFSFERFIKAINKVDIKETAAQTPNIKKEEESLFLRSGKKIVQIKIKDVMFVEATGNYINIVLSDNQIQVREKLSEIIDLLPQNEFFQVHKSFIVAKKYIDEIQGNRISIDSYTLPVGKTYKLNVNKLIQ